MDLLNVVPIVPLEAQDEMGPAASSRRTELARCFRSQLPIELAFGVTHHKSKGATLDRQTFTALSRCRDINNMLLEDFSQERLQAIGNSASFPARLSALDRIRLLEDLTRQTFGLPPSTREPRPPRPTTTSDTGGMGRGRTGGRSRDMGRGRARGGYGR